LKEEKIGARSLLTMGEKARDKARSCYREQHAAAMI
jgi:hypothetical protein